MNQGGYSTLSSNTCSKCGDIYSNVYSEHTCPSFCNFNTSYTTLQNMYAPSTIYIPPDEAARLYNYPIGVSSNYLVTQPQIVNWDMDTEFNNISGMPVSQDPKEVYAQVVKVLSVLKGHASDLHTLNAEVNKLVGAFKNANAQNQLELAKKAVALEKQAHAYMNDVVSNVQFITSSATNVAPFTVRDSSLQSKVNEAIASINKIKNIAQSTYYKVKTSVDLLKDKSRSVVIAHQTPQNLNLRKSMPSYSAIMSTSAPIGMINPVASGKIRKLGA